MANQTINIGGSITAGGNVEIRQITETISSQTPQSEIMKALSIIQEEIPKLPIAREARDEITNEIEGAKIQAKKTEPDKKRMAEKLKNATEILKESAATAAQAVSIGNLIGKVILWCGEQWTEWII